MGTGRSYQFCKDAVATIHDRYMPTLHQKNEDLEKILDYISDKQQLNECFKKVSKLAECINNLSDKMKEVIQTKIKINQILDIGLLMDNGCKVLRRCYDFIERENPFRSLGSQIMAKKLNEIVHGLNDDDFERFRFIDIKIGRASCRERLSSPV